MLFFARMHIHTFVGLNVFDCEHCDSRKDTNVSATVQTNIPTLPRPARPYR